MYLRNIALFVAIYGRAALAALPPSCEDDGAVCPANGDKCIIPLNAEYEPTGVGQVWFSQCCTVSKSSTADPSNTETKKYCYNYSMKGYPSNQLHGRKPDCSENASGNDAWTLVGQCRTTGGTDDPFDTLPLTSNGCPAEYDQSTTYAYEIGDTVEANGVVYTCEGGAAAFCNLYAPDLRGVGANYWKATSSCTGTGTPTGSPTWSVGSIQDGCPKEYDSNAIYEANESVSVPRDDGISIIYMCKPFPESVWCSDDAYSPMNTETLCNGEVCWSQAWNKVGPCEGTFTPTGTPTFDPANLSGCPEEYTAGTAYEAGDKISVTSQGEDYGKIYQCKTWPDGAFCVKEAYSPSNIDSNLWKDAWTYVGGCYGTIAPTPSPTFDPASLSGCPEEYEAGADYEAGDKVSVTPAGEDYGKIYKCKAWPEGKFCAKDIYSPANTEKQCNGEVCWPEAWIYTGGCYGTISPTPSPTFDPASLSGCPEEYDSSVTYEPGDKVSVIPQGEDYGKIYKCKAWPNNERCNQDGYSPVDTEEEKWSEGWTYEGGCYGTITPTQSPVFQTLSAWDLGGCPDEYMPNNSEYKPGDVVSVAKDKDNTRGVVWRCKNEMSAKWCQYEGYAPGTANGGEAWEKLGYCEGTMSPTGAPTQLSQNPDDAKKLCQFKKMLETATNGVYVVLQAESWVKGGTTVSTGTGGTPLKLYTAGDLVRYGREAQKCNTYPFSGYCISHSPYIQDSPDYNPTLSSQGWDTATCEDIVSAGDLNGDEDEFNPSTGGPVFASNGDMLVNKDGNCVNDAINPEDYFKSGGVAGCSEFVPSAEPSSAPSLSETPSSKPSALLPSAEPSSAPSLSSQPSVDASMEPSKSAQPSAKQSLNPSAGPSLFPSAGPSTSAGPTAACDANCQGVNACTTNTEGPIGCGSCNGDGPCAYMGGPVGNKSCLGQAACLYAFPTSIIGDRSCVGNLACYDHENEVRNDSCIGEYACIRNKGIISDGACIGKQACCGNRSNRAPGECIGDFSCCNPGHPVCSCEH